MSKISPHKRLSPSPLKESNEIKKVDHEISFNLKKCVKRNLIPCNVAESFTNHNHSLNCANVEAKSLPEDIKSNIENELFCKPAKKQVKKKKITSDATPSKRPSQTFSINNGDSFTLNSDKSDSKTLSALEKLGLKFDELKASVIKSRQAFSSYKVSTFFCMKPDFIKDFGDNLLKAESAVDVMGLSLNKLLNRNHDSTVEDTEVGSKEVLHDIPRIEGSLTPPSSEVGGNDDIALVEDESVASKKRKHDSFDDTNSLKKPRVHLNDLERKPSLSLLKELDLKPISHDETSTEFSQNGVTSDLHNEASSTKEPSNEEVADENTEEEYEVSKIKNFTKLKGQYVYHVSWRGYDSDDDTFEPANNLTGCDEALSSFFEQRLLDRLNSSTADELKVLNLPCTNEVKEMIYNAFEKIALPLSFNEKKMITAEVLKTTIAIKKKEEVADDIMKFIAFKDPSNPRYKKLQSSIFKSLKYRDVMMQRELQLAHLRSWERNINTICSDPSPITVENTVDLAYPPMDFRYINAYLAGENITIPNDPVVGCECVDCSPSQKSCCAEQMSSSFAYNRYGRLRISLGIPIYECNKACSCSLDCTNRVVQKGRKIALSIFRTANGRGWGAKALEHIKKDTFVSEYVGEVISSEEAERRGKKYDSQGCTYLFDLDYNKGELNPYTVDAAKYGNVSHFINHSCDPNLAVYNVWVNCLDPDLPRLALFAVADIKKGEELTFDYNSGSNKQMTATLTEKTDENGTLLLSPKHSTDSMDSFASPSVVKMTKSRTLNAGKTECRCGAINCRKFFF